MEYIYGTRRPTAISVVSEDPEKGIQVPFLGDIDDVRTRPEMLSGYDRANWFAQNTLGMPRDRAVFASANGRDMIGTNARGVNGAEADEYWTDSYWTGYNVVNLPEQYTEQADDVGSIWKVQTKASDGLNYLTWDQVYVDQDTQSVWS
jgi:hypothetical protein